MPHRTQTAQRINLYVTAYQSALEQIPALRRREKPDYSLRIHASIRRQIKAGDGPSPYRIGSGERCPSPRLALAGTNRAAPNCIFAGLVPKPPHGPARMSTCSKGCHRRGGSPTFCASRNKRPYGPVSVACHRAPPFSNENAERLNARPHSIPRKQLPKNVGRPTNIYSALLVARPR
jgi:hypothetical protein